MKKNIIIAVIALSTVGLSTLGFAETVEKTRGVTKTVIVGQIDSVDTAKNSVVIKDTSTGLKKTIYVNEAQITALKTGDNVRVTLGKASNAALKVTK